MKNLIYSILFLTLIPSFVKAQLVSTASGTASFFSQTPVEDINAQSQKMLGVMNIKTNELALSIDNVTFVFPNKLMQEHFNEKYMESEKYPKSTFKGKISEAVNLTNDGEYKVTVVGKLNIHGVEQERTITGTIVVSKGVVTIKSDFMVKVADHKIEIPKLVVSNIAEEIKVSIIANLQPKK
jgi:polyisoprenoid-binding protein YceI